MTFTDLKNRTRPCLPPKIKHPFPRKGKTDMPSERDRLASMGMEKVAAFISRAANYTAAKFPRKRRDSAGKVMSVSLV